MLADGVSGAVFVFGGEPILGGAFVVTKFDVGIGVETYEVHGTC